MNQSSHLQRVLDTINKHATLAIALSSNPTPDAISAGVGLYLGLTKLGKHVTLASASGSVNTLGLTGGEKMQSKLTTGGDNLVVSFPYVEGSIDKVTYTIEGNRFNLLIIPRDESKKVSPNQVEYSYSGGKVDAVIVLDTPNLQGLGSLYGENKNQFAGNDVVNIDRHLTNANFGTVNFVQKNASSVSELVLSILSNIGVELDKDIATALYTGLSAATNNFTSYSVNAQTMETAGYLLKSGAVKKQVPQATQTAASAGRAPGYSAGLGSRPGQQPSGFPYTQQNMYTPPARMQGAYAPTQPSTPGPQQAPYRQQYQSPYSTPPVSSQPQAPYAPPMQEPDKQYPPQNTQQDSSYLQDTEAKSGQGIQTPIQQDSSTKDPSQDSKQSPSYQSSSQHEAQFSHADKAVENKEVQQGQQSGDPEGKKAPREWLKPKIFKGSNLV